MTAGTTAMLAGTLSTQAAAAPSPAPEPAPAGNHLAAPDDPPPAGFASWKDVAAMQGRLTRAATEITAAAQSAGGDGLGSITADPDERAVRVYWKRETAGQDGCTAVRMR